MNLKLEVLKSLQKSPLRSHRVGPTIPTCPPECGDCEGLIHGPYPYGWVPPDFNERTGRSKTHKQVRCPECGLYTIWRIKTAGQP